jgi:hypothetical protein
MKNLVKYRTLFYQILFSYMPIDYKSLKSVIALFFAEYFNRY